MKSAVRIISVFILVIGCVSLVKGAAGDKYIQEVREVSQEVLSLGDPCMVIGAANSFIREGGLREFLDHYNFGIYPNVTLDQLFLRGVEYSVTELQARVSYGVKSSFVEEKSEDPNKLQLSIGTFFIDVDQNGECQIRSVAGAPDAGNKFTADVVTVTPSELKEKLDKGRQYIAAGKLSTVKSDKYPWTYFQSYSSYGGGETEYVSKVIKARIPETATLNHLKLVEIEYQYPSKTTELVFCFESTIYRKDLRETRFYSVTMDVDDKGVCSHELPIKGSQDNHSIWFEQEFVSEIDPNEHEDVFEAVYKYMFTEAVYKDKDLKMRFLEIQKGGVLPDEFYDRFSEEIVPVRSPFKKHDDYEGNFRGVRYGRSGDAMFYTIMGIIKFDEAHIFVDSNICHYMPWGYVYTLEKKDGKWMVVHSSQTWMSREE